MNRLAITLLLIFTTLLPAAAQKGLCVNTFFGNQIAGAHEVHVTGAPADSLGLYRYRSIEFTDTTLMTRVTNAVTADGARADQKELDMRNGHVYYGFYQLAPIPHPDKPRKQLIRYMIYLDHRQAPQPANRLTLVYLETDLNARCVKRIFK